MEASINIENNNNNINNINIINNISDISHFNTTYDIGQNQEGPFSKELTLGQILQIALNKNANVIVRTVRNTWYIKNIGLKKQYQDIQNIINNNITNNIKSRSNTWLIKYR